MTAENFCYWLQGYFEILKPAMNSATLSEGQVEVIKTHLGYVFAAPKTPVTPTGTGGGAGYPDKPRFMPGWTPDSTVC